MGSVSPAVVAACVVAAAAAVLPVVDEVDSAVAAAGFVAVAIDAAELCKKDDKPLLKFLLR